MRWPWRPCGRDREEARQQLADARARLAETHRLGQEVSEVAQQLREIRHRNHFGTMIEQALRGQR